MPATGRADRCDHAIVPAEAAILNPNIPRDLEAVIAQSDGQDAAARYASAVELWADLMRFLKGQRPGAAIGSLAKGLAPCQPLGAMAVTSPHSLQLRWQSLP